MVHLGEELLPPDGHGGAQRGNDGLARQEVAGAHGIQQAFQLPGLLEGPGDVRLVHEAEADPHVPGAVGERLDGHLFPQRDARNVARLDVDEQVVGVQHLVVLEVVQHGPGHHAGMGREEDGGAVHAGGSGREDRLQEGQQLDRLGVLALAQQSAAVVPCGHDQVQHTGHEQGEPAAFRDLERVGGEEGHVHAEEGARGGDA